MQPRTAPQPVFERQIRNALDAGDGDYHLRELRDRMAAEPENMQVRLDLAEAYRQRGFPEVALEHCRLAAARFPDSAEIALALAKSLRRAGRQQEAGGVSGHKGKRGEKDRARRVVVRCHDPHFFAPHDNIPLALLQRGNTELKNLSGIITGNGYPIGGSF
jgi:tetratricopeptide (TPR) repeat protein